MAKKVVYEYDYSKLTMNFRNDDDKQREAYTYLTNIPPHKRIDFMSSLVLRYVEKEGITSCEELSKIVKSGKYFNNSKVLSEEQTREIRSIIAEFIGKKGEISSLPNVQGEQSEDKTKEKNIISVNTHKDDCSESELGSAEADVLASMMNMFS